VLKNGRSERVVQRSDREQQLFYYTREEDNDKESSALTELDCQSRRKTRQSEEPPPIHERETTRGGKIYAETRIEGWLRKQVGGQTRVVAVLF